MGLPPSRQAGVVVELCVVGCKGPPTGRARLGLFCWFDGHKPEEEEEEEEEQEQKEGWDGGKSRDLAVGAGAQSGDTLRFVLLCTATPSLEQWCKSFANYPPLT